MKALMPTLINSPTEPRKRGRPTLAETPGVRFMIHLQPKHVEILRAIGDGSISRGVMRLADGHEGKIEIVTGPKPPTLKEIRATERARRRVLEALDVVNQMLNERWNGGAG